MNKKILSLLKRSPKTASAIALKLDASKLNVYRALHKMVCDGSVYVRGKVAEERRGPRARLYAQVQR